MTRPVAVGDRGVRLADCHGSRAIGRPEHDAFDPLAGERRRERRGTPGSAESITKTWLDSGKFLEDVVRLPLRLIQRGFVAGLVAHGQAGVEDEADGGWDFLVTADRGLREETRSSQGQRRYAVRSRPSWQAGAASS